MIDAVWLVDPLTLHIVAANRAATSMLNMEPGKLVGKAVTELAATPEDQFFWEDVAAGLTDRIFSETLLLLKDGSTVPVERRVSRVKLSTEIVVYQVAISNRTEQRRVEPVSYTHLDVYKRQLENRASCSIRTRSYSMPTNCFTPLCARRAG